MQQEPSSVSLPAFVARPSSDDSRHHKEPAAPQPMAMAGRPRARTSVIVPARVVTISSLQDKAQLPYSPTDVLGATQAGRFEGSPLSPGPSQPPPLGPPPLAAHRATLTPDKAFAIGLQASPKGTRGGGGGGGGSASSSASDPPAAASALHAHRDITSAAPSSGRGSNDGSTSGLNARRSAPIAGLRLDLPASARGSADVGAAVPPSTRVPPSSSEGRLVVPNTATVADPTSDAAVGPPTSGALCLHLVAMLLRLSEECVRSVDRATAALATAWDMTMGIAACVKEQSSQQSRERLFFSETARVVAGLHIMGSALQHYSDGQDRAEEVTGAGLEGLRLVLKDITGQLAEQRHLFLVTGRHLGTALDAAATTAHTAPTRNATHDRSVSSIFGAETSASATSRPPESLLLPPGAHHPKRQSTDSLYSCFSSGSPSSTTGGMRGPPMIVTLAPGVGSGTASRDSTAIMSSSVEQAMLPALSTESLSHSPLLTAMRTTGAAARAPPALLSELQRHVRAAMAAIHRSLPSVQPTSEGTGGAGSGTGGSSTAAGTESLRPDARQALHELECHQCEVSQALLLADSATLDAICEALWATEGVAAAAASDGDGTDNANVRDLVRVLARRVTGNAAFPAPTLALLREISPSLAAAERGAWPFVPRSSSDPTAPSASGRASAGGSRRSSVAVSPAQAPMAPPGESSSPTLNHHVSRHAWSAKRKVWGATPAPTPHQSDATAASVCREGWRPFGSVSEPPSSTDSPVAASSPFRRRDLHDDNAPGNANMSFTAAAAEAHRRRSVAAPATMLELLDAHLSSPTTQRVAERQFAQSVAFRERVVDLVGELSESALAPPPPVLALPPLPPADLPLPGGVAPSPSFPPPGQGLTLLQQYMSLRMEHTRTISEGSSSASHSFSSDGGADEEREGGEGDAWVEHGEAVETEQPAVISPLLDALVTYHCAQLVYEEAVARAAVRQQEHVAATALAETLVKARWVLEHAAPPVSPALRGSVMYDVPASASDTSTPDDLPPPTPRDDDAEHHDAAAFHFSDAHLLGHVDPLFAATARFPTPTPASLLAGLGPDGIRAAVAACNEETLQALVDALLDRNAIDVTTFDPVPDREEREGTANHNRGESPNSNDRPVSTPSPTGSVLSPMASRHNSARLASLLTMGRSLSRASLGGRGRGPTLPALMATATESPTEGALIPMRSPEGRPSAVQEPSVAGSSMKQANSSESAATSTRDASQSATRWVGQAEPNPSTLGAAPPPPAVDSADAGCQTSAPSTCAFAVSVLRTAMRSQGDGAGDDDESQGVGVGAAFVPVPADLFSTLVAAYEAMPQLHAAKSAAEASVRLAAAEGRELQRRVADAEAVVELQREMLLTQRQRESSNILSSSSSPAPVLGASVGYLTRSPAAGATAAIAAAPSSPALNNASSAAVVWSEQRRGRAMPAADVIAASIAPNGGGVSMAATADDAYYMYRHISHQKPPSTTSFAATVAASPPPRGMALRPSAHHPLHATTSPSPSYRHLPAEGEGSAVQGAKSVTFAHGPWSPANPQPSVGSPAPRGPMSAPTPTMDPLDGYHRHDYLNQHFDQQRREQPPAVSVSLFPAGPHSQQARRGHVGVAAERDEYSFQGLL